MSVKLELPVGIDEDLCKNYCQCYNKETSECTLRYFKSECFPGYTNFCAMNSILQVSQNLTEVRNGGDY